MSPPPLLILVLSDARVVVLAGDAWSWMGDFMSSRMMEGGMPEERGEIQGGEKVGSWFWPCWEEEEEEGEG